MIRALRRSPAWLALIVLVALALVVGVVLVLRPAAGSDDATTAGGPPSSSTVVTAPATNGPRPPVDRSPTVGVSRPPTTRARTSAPVAPPAHRAPAKGVSVWDFAGLGRALTDSHVGWYYNWSPQPSAGVGTGVEFVPMIWGAASVTPSTLDKARAAGTTILGFNEPDFASQANLGVDQALDLWPRLEATGRRLGSPAVAYGGDTPGGWLDRFMTGAHDRGRRVDFITLHWYGSDFSAAAVGQLRSYLSHVYSRYHKPIWLTEFALIRFADGATTYPTADQQVAFIRGATAMLGQLSYVERYAWFALPTGDHGDATGLYRPDGTATPMGLAYRAA